MIVNIKKIDEELQIVYGEVYAPFIPDSDGEYMTVEGVRNMAHSFMKNAVLHVIDENHNNITNGSYPVESFIARDGDPDFIPDAWVVGVKVPDTEVWSKVVGGDLNGFSVEALVTSSPKIIEVELESEISGETYPDETNHVHEYSVSFSPDGQFLGGMTDLVNGHYHTISKFTVTDLNSDHTHRFSIMENVNIVSTSENKSTS